MKKVIYLTPHFAVTGALQPEDLAEAAARGFKSVLSNLPDGESVQYPSAGEEAQYAEQAGLGFRHVPVVKSEVFSDRVIEDVINALGELQGPVLAHCASGLRSAVVWAAAAARSQPADCIIEALKRAGYDLAAIRDELEEQHGRPHATDIPAALDCRCDGSPRATT